MFSAFSKHATLLRKCYPVSPPEPAHLPRPSELAYVIYYVQARPEKLAKVGAWLEVRAKADLWSERDPTVLVSLHILNKCMEACPKDVKFIAKNALSMIRDALATGRDSVLDGAFQSWLCFCRYFDALVGYAVDEDITSHVNIVVSKWTHLANPESNKSSDKLPLPFIRRRVLALKALLDIISAPVTKTIDVKSFLRKAFPVILSNASWTLNSTLPR